MRIRPIPAAAFVAPLCLFVAACSNQQSPAADADADAAAAAAPAAAAAAAPAPATAAAFPASLKVVGDGYPQSGAPCRRIGESEATVDWLDDSADLVGCPTDTDAEALGGKVVGMIDGITLVSVPAQREGAMPAGDSTAAAAPSPAKDLIRGKGGLEEKCLAKVAAQGTKVVGTNRIEESEAAIAIYVNVEGGSAPWRCLAYRDGSVGEVMFTGDEGGL